jgi:peptide deformylase
MSTPSVREITIFGNPVLRQRGKRIGTPTDDTRALVDDMLATMAAAQGIGLAAQQIGLPLQLAVVDVTPVKDPERPSSIEIDGVEQPLAEWMPLILIDATVESVTSRKETETEGCLSFPEITGDVTRPARVRVTTKTLDGGTKTFEATGLLARAIQHEYDHLQGVLFVDRMSTVTRTTLHSRLKKLKRETEEKLRTTG